MLIMWTELFFSFLLRARVTWSDTFLCGRRGVLELITGFDGVTKCSCTHCTGCKRVPTVYQQRLDGLVSDRINEGLC